MSGWKTASLREVCSLIARGIAPKYVDEGGTLVLNQKCVRDHAIRYELGRRHNAAAKRIPQERFVQLGDVLINSTGTGTLGRVAQVRSQPAERATVDTHVTIVRPNPREFYPGFFGFALILLEGGLAQSGEGASGQTELARTTIAKFEITYPTDLEEQQRIVAVLDEAFVAIATATANTKKNLANVQEFFEQASTGLLTEEGDGWQERALGEICSISSKLVDPKLDEFINLPHIGAGNIASCTGEMSNVLTAGEEALVSGKFLFDRGTVLYSKIRPYLMKVCRPDFAGLCSADVYPLAPKHGELDRDFLFRLLLGRDFTTYAEAGSARAGMPKVNRDHLFAYRFRLPPVEKQRELAERIDGLADRCRDLTDCLERKLRQLAALKESLLHRAFSGELIDRDLLAA